jgi:hypothetical protein
MKRVAEKNAEKLLMYKNDSWASATLVGCIPFLDRG